MSSEDRVRKDQSEKGDESAFRAAPNSLPASESPDEQISSLTARLDQVEAEKREADDRYLRAAADLDNFKKKTRRDQLDAARYAAEPFIRELLPVIDNLERAVAHAESSGDASLLEGVSLVVKSLHDLLKQNGVSVIETEVGEVFDPKRHEAIDRRLSSQGPNRVLELWQRGYTMHDRLLRPARVVVSSAPVTPTVANGKDDA